MVRGGKFKLWTLPKRAGDRAEIERLTGQRDVPILLLDDDSVVTGSGSIAAWPARTCRSEHGCFRGQQLVLLDGAG